MHHSSSLRTRNYLRVKTLPVRLPFYRHWSTPVSLSFSPIFSLTIRLVVSALLLQMWCVLSTLVHSQCQLTLAPFGPVRLLLHLLKVVPLLPPVATRVRWSLLLLRLFMHLPHRVHPRRFPLPHSSARHHRQNPLCLLLSQLPPPTTT